MDSEWKGKNNRAVAILRVSTKRQEQGVSHRLQKQQVDGWVERHKLDMVKVFQISESAKDSDNRRKYHEAIEWSLKNKVRHVLFYMGDREARNLTDNEYNEKLVLQDRIVLHYVRESKILHKDSPESDFTARDYQAVGNKDFSRRLRVKVSDAQRKKAEDGWYPYNHVPLGYIHKYPTDEYGRQRKRGTTIVRDPIENNVKQVQREFELCAKGDSVAVIRTKIIDEGFILPSKKKTYSKHGIEGRLKHKFYRGKFDCQGVEYQGKHELIISKAILDAVDGRFGHKKITRRSSEETGIFAGGWLRCGHPECGLQITCEHTEKRIKVTGQIKEYKHYRCSNSRGVHKSLKGLYVSEDKLLQQFEPALDAISISKERAQEIADALNEADRLAKSTIHNEMEQYRAALKRLHDKRMSYLDLLADKQISNDDCKLALEHLEADQKHFTTLLEQAQYKISDAWKFTAQTVLELAKNAKSLWIAGTLSEKLEILKKVCWNPILDGATLRYDLQKPFATIAQMRGNPDWRPLALQLRNNCFSYVA